MAEPMYRIGPGDGTWLTYAELLDKIRHWHFADSNLGVPSITISKDAREPAPAAVVPLD